MKGTQKLATDYLIKQLPTAIAYIDRSFRIVYASARWAELFELDHSEIIGTHAKELTVVDFDGWENAMKQALLGNVHTCRQKRNTIPATDQVWFSWEFSPWLDAQDNIIGLMAKTENCSECHEHHESISKLKRLLNEKARMARIGSWEYDAVKDTLTWSGMTKEIHEVPPEYEPDLDKGIDFYEEGYSRNTISMAIDKAMRSGTPWKEKLQIVTATGRSKWVIASGKPFFKDEKFMGLMGTIQDVDDQVQSNEKTRESEKLLKTLIDNLPLNVFIKDRDSRKILVNRSECNYLGVSGPEEVLGKNDFDLYDPHIAQISRDEDLFVMDTLTPMLGKETTNIKKDGSVTTFLTSKIPLVDPHGEAYGLVGISLDISHIKQKEKELRDLINVTSLQNKKLVNFAHIVSHNLRSHTANFSMLLDFLATETDEREKETILDMLTHASDNLLEALDNLNEVININNNVNLDKKPVDLRGKIEASKQSLQAFLINNRAQIVNKVPEGLSIPVIPAYLESILVNFITNGVKYRHPDRDPVLTLTAVRANGYVILSIADNGLGIDLKKYGDKLFGMYKTFHSNKDARGMGLYITKNQIEAMKGKVAVTSEVGKGTTFKIHFNEKN